MFEISRTLNAALLSNEVKIFAFFLGVHILPVCVSAANHSVICITVCPCVCVYVFVLVRVSLHPCMLTPRTQKRMIDNSGWLFPPAHCWVQKRDPLCLWLSFCLVIGNGEPASRLYIPSFYCSQNQGSRQARQTFACENCTFRAKMCTSCARGSTSVSVSGLHVHTWRLCEQSVRVNPSTSLFSSSYFRSPPHSHSLFCPLPFPLSFPYLLLSALFPFPFSDTPPTPTPFSSPLPLSLSSPPLSPPVSLYERVCSVSSISRWWRGTGSSRD